MRVRPYTVADTPALRRIQAACFPPPYPAELWWSPAQIASHVAIFPPGALAVEIDGDLVASATAHRLSGGEDHTWAEASADGWLTNHDPAGDTLYGVDIAVLPAFRGRGVARALYHARFALVRELGLRRFLAGSRISGYHRHGHLTPEAYAAEVVAGRLVDPVVTPQLKAGLRPLGIVRDYLPDAEAGNCALLMEWTP